jgi:hypothetical protein
VRLALGLQISSGWSRLEANGGARVVVRGWCCNWDKLQARVGVMVFLDPRSVRDHRGRGWTDQARRRPPPTDKCGKPTREDGGQHFVLHFAAFAILYGLHAVIPGFTTE